MVAAPTQTRKAWLASTIWGEFNLAGFVRDLREALPEGRDVDLESIVLAGHSGAGCNPAGGLAHAAVSDIPLRGLAFIDTCFDVDVAERVSELGGRTPIWIYWQRFTWPRAFEPFVAQLSRSGRVSIRVTEMRSSPDDPHTRIVYSAVDQILREWLPDNPKPLGTEVNSPPTP